MGIGGSTPPWQRNVKGVLPTMPIFGWGGGGIWRKKRKQVQLIMGRVRGRNDPEESASRQKRTQPLLGVVVGVGACWRSCAHRAVLSRQAP